MRQLLAGKVLGNTGLAVGQMALYAALGLVGLAFTSFGSFLPSVTGALGWFLVFFLVGFLLIACLWAVAGALASRTEDVADSTPVTMLLLGIFFGSGTFLEGTAQTVLSYVPPASAVLMPQRILEGDALWWEPVVALALLLVAAGVVVIGAERLTGAHCSRRRAGCRCARRGRHRGDHGRPWVDGGLGLLSKVRLT